MKKIKPNPPKTSPKSGPNYSWKHPVQTPRKKHQFPQENPELTPRSIYPLYFSAFAVAPVFLHHRWWVLDRWFVCLSICPFPASFWFISSQHRENNEFLAANSKLSESVNGEYSMRFVVWEPWALRDNSDYLSSGRPMAVRSELRKILDLFL